MNILRNQMIELLNFLDLSETLIIILVDTVLLISAIIISLIGYFIIRFIFKLTFKKILKRTKNIFIKALLESSVIPKSLKLIPLFFLVDIVSYLPTYELIADKFIIIIFSYFVLRIVLAMLDLVNSLYISYNKRASFKPIKGILTAIKFLVVLVVIIIVISNLIGESPVVILTGLGAMSAVLMLIFKDSILGLVAGFQMSVNDLVQIGDWIEMPNYGADGNVIDVTLTFIRIENWDRTTVTIPAYKLISESFVNWRSVFEQGGRRIKRAVHIDAESVKIVDDNLYQKLLKVDYIKPYLTERKLEIDEYNQSNQIDTSVILNGRRLTNLGVYRVYLLEYLKNNPHIHKDMWRIVRQLENKNKGIPLEVYAFSNKTGWEDYEAIMSDIFDHIYATTSYFDLKIFQEPSGNDFKDKFNQIG